MKILNTNNLEFALNKKIYFYGLTLYTKYANEGAKKKNLKISGVFDTTILEKKSNNLESYSLEVQPQEILKNLEKDTVFIVTCSHFYSVERHLNAFGFYNIYDSCSLIKTYLEDETLNNHNKIEVSRAHAALLERRNHITKQFDKFVIPSIDLILTEKCTLKCADCANLMPYFSTPKDSALDQMLLSLQVIMDKVDMLTELRILGGEPFIFKKINEILNFAIPQKKIEHIVVYTNGTIVPRAETLEVLKNNKIMLEITDYGKLSRNFQKLVDTCKNNKINYLVRNTIDDWDDSANILQPTRTEKENLDIFNECCAKYLYTLMHGKLYRCPFSASLDAIKKVSLTENNSIEINEKTSRKNLEEYVYAAKHFDACRYCQGRSKLSSRVPAARQSKTIREPFEFLSSINYK